MIDPDDLEEMDCTLCQREDSTWLIYGPDKDNDEDEKAEKLIALLCGSCHDTILRAQSHKMSPEHMVKGAPASEAPFILALINAVLNDRAVKVSSASVAT